MKRIVALLAVVQLLSTNTKAQSVVDAFNPNVNGTIKSVVRQSDGKLVIGGSFTSVGGTARTNLARLNADGSIDPSFAPNPDGTVEALALSSTGQIIVGGTFTTIAGGSRANLARLASTGSLDATFTANTDGTVLSLAIQTDGKILVGGAFANVGGTGRTFIARLDSAAGAVDAAFNPAPNGSVRSIAMNGGSILIGGDFTSVVATTRNRAARLASDGSLDTTFNPNVTGTRVNAIAVQNDGKVLLGGLFTMVGAISQANFARVSSTTGAIDASLAIGTDGEVSALAIQSSSGGIMLGGSFSTVGGSARTRLARITTANAVDASFNLSITGTSVLSLVTVTDGTTVFAGTFSAVAGQTRNNIARTGVTGALDQTFTSAANFYVQTFARQADGKLLVGGAFDTLAGTTQPHLIRLNADGTVDTSFTPNIDGYVFTICVQRDGRILIGGGFSVVNGAQRYKLARLNSDGTLDATFDPNPNNNVLAILEQPDGAILVGGYFTTMGGQSRNFLARVSSTGVVEPGFNPNLNNEVLAITLQTDGRILVGGEFTMVSGATRNRIVRLLSTGAVDTSFVGDANNSVRAIVMQPDGRILVAGNFFALNSQERPRLGRLLADGTLDNSFFTYVQAGVSSVILHTDGGVVIAGDFESINEDDQFVPHARVARVLSDGSLDTSFADPEFDRIAYGIVQLADGKFMVGGLFTSADSQPRFYIARLSNPQGGTETLSVNTAGTSVTWMRSGAIPEVDEALFEVSTNGTTFTSLGSGTRITGGWSLSGLSLPLSGPFTVRVRSRHHSGRWNAGHGFIESSLYTQLNESPGLTLSLTNAALTYLENAAPTGLALGSTLTDTNTSSFNGGSLVVSYLDGNTSTDLLSIQHEGDGAGQVGVTNGTIYFGGVAIGSFPISGASSGLVGSNLVVTFNTASATTAAVQAVIRRLGFSNSSENPSSATRNIRIQPIDSLGFFGLAVVSVQVLPVNDAPSVSFTGNVTVAEDSGSYSNTIIASFSVGPAAETSNQALQGYTLSNDNTGLFSGQPAINNAGALTFTPAANSNGVAIVTVIAQDTGGTSNGGVDKTTNTFTITVTPVNDPSVVTFTTNNVVVLEDSGAFAGGAGFAIFSPGPANESAQTLLGHVLSNDNSTLFSVQPAINTSGLLTFTPTANSNGVATVTVISQDNGGTSPGVDKTTNIFTITIIPVNDAPSFTLPMTTLTVAEDSGPHTNLNFATSLSAGPPNESAQTLFFNVLANTNPSLFSSGPTLSSGGTLVFALATNANGSAMITVQLVDSGDNSNGGTNGSVSQTFTITVTAVNDAPSFTKGADQIVMSTAGAQTIPGWATGISAGAPDETGQTLTFNITGNTNPGLLGAGPSVASDGTLTYTPTPGVFGTTTITITLSDGVGGTSSSQTFTITVASTRIYVDTVATQIPGDTFTLPIKIDSSNVEAGTSFTLLFNTNHLTYGSATIGAGLPGGTLLLNTSQTAAGFLGVVASHPAGTNRFSSGTSTIVDVVFTVVSTSPATNTPVTFGNSPVLKQVANTNATELIHILYVTNVVTITNTALIVALESDVAPRPSGNGSLSVADSVQTARFAAGLDTATPGGEYQRADSAPRGTSGDGAITVADHVQAQRYAAGLDAPQAAAGPSSGGGALMPAQSITRVRLLDGATRRLSVIGRSAPAGGLITVSVMLDATGVENSLGFSLGYDPATLNLVSGSAGSGATGATVLVNANNAATGRGGAIVSLPLGSSFRPGAQEVARLVFRVRPGAAGAATISFTDSTVIREIVDSFANPLSATYSAGTVTFSDGGLQTSARPVMENGTFRFSTGYNGAAMSNDDAAQLEVWWAVSPTAPTAQWTRLTNSMSLNNGAVEIQDTSAGNTGLRFYKVVPRP